MAFVSSHKGMEIGTMRDIMPNIVGEIRTTYLREKHNSMGLFLGLLTNTNHHKTNTRGTPTSTMGYPHHYKQHNIRMRECIQHGEPEMPTFGGKGSKTDTTWIGRKIGMSQQGHSCISENIFLTSLSRSF